MSPAARKIKPKTIKKVSTKKPKVIGLNTKRKAVVGIIMGSTSDMPIMEKATEVLDEFGIGYEVKIVSAHRTPDFMAKYAKAAKGKGLKVIISGAGGAAHLPGMVASFTTLPVIGVPINITALEGIDSLLSIMQMPKGVPVATVAIDNSTNAALLALRMLSIGSKSIADKLSKFALKKKKEVLKQK